MTSPTPRTSTAPSDLPRRATPLSADAAIVVTASDPGPATATVTGELDLTCAESLAEAVCSALDAHAGGVLLDLAGVRFFDCAGLHALERARRHAERRGARLVLGNSSAAVDLLLALLGGWESMSAQTATGPEQPTTRAAARREWATRPRPHSHRQNLTAIAPQP
jgi:anti-anti-sigma factor